MKNRRDVQETPGYISLSKISKTFRIYNSGRDRLMDAVSFGRANRGRDFRALRNVDLEVEPGTTMGILGRNGAGKSTLLRVISGNLQPTKGRMRIVGQPIFLQMGAGFNPDYTGRENVMLNGLILGLDRKKILQRFDEIEAFADIGEFMDQPVRTYSSGMRSRLGFAVAVNVEPDILIVDEALSVGDAVFRQMGIQKMNELRDSGATILLVSHGLSTVRSFCNRAALMHEGRLLSTGETAEIADEYQALVASLSSKTADLSDAFPDEDDEAMMASLGGNGSSQGGMRRGSGEVRITDVQTIYSEDAPAGVVRPGDTVGIRLELRAASDIGGVSASITLRNKVGIEVFSTSTSAEGLEISMKSGDEVAVEFTVELPLRPGNYGIVASVSGGDRICDWLGVAGTFAITKVDSSDKVSGLVRLPVKVEASHLKRG